MIRQRTSSLLYDYWDSVRQSRIAPCRYEIEPSKIAALLPETFILESEAPGHFRIRLAGTRICDQFGRELRGCALLDLWKPADREGLETALHNVVSDGAVVVARFSAAKEDGRRADFEMTVMPLIHTGNTISRMLGCMTAIDPPVWLGTDLLHDFELKTVDLIWPAGEPLHPWQHDEPPVLATTSSSTVTGSIMQDKRRRFRVLQGGLSTRTE